MNKKMIQIKDKTYVLLFDEFEENVEVDDLLKIDYSNLIGEMVTFPVIVNRFGQLLAEAESQVAEAKLNLEVFSAKLKEKIREEAIKEGGKKPTEEALNNAVISDKTVQIFQKAVINTIKNRDIINSIFWSAKDKSNKLDKLSLTVTPGDLSDSILESKINNVLIKKTKKLIG